MVNKELFERLVHKSVTQCNWVELQLGRIERPAIVISPKASISSGFPDT